MDKNTMLDKYARLIVEAGINLKEGEGLIITASLPGLELARRAAQVAWRHGAKHVEVMLGDEELTLTRYKNAWDTVFENFPKWKVDQLIAMYEDNYHHLYIASANPELLKDISPQLIAKDQKTASTAMAPALGYRMNGHTKWTIAAAASPGWAKSVFPDLPEEEAMDQLWDKIAKAVRLDHDDPVQAWKEHDNNLKKHVDFLNENKFTGLKLKGPGTDLDVGLPDGHIWMGGSKDSLAGDPFIANMPTEEAFTTPHKLKVNGKLKATKPLSLNGTLVDNFGFEFKDGKVVDFYAAKGYETLKHLLTNDEGAPYLGEVALVPDDSPISKMNVLFNNTLFDENASVHFALGRSYPYTMENGAEKTREELEAMGSNFSLIHTDFMVGGKEMEIVAYDKEGKETPIFSKGNWVI